MTEPLFSKDLCFKTSSDDSWHIGEYWQAPVTDLPEFVDEGHNKSYDSKEVVEWHYISKPECFFWDSEKEDYFPLEVKHDSSSPEEKMMSLFELGYKLKNDRAQASKELAHNCFLSRAYAIREWLLINASCNKSIYIDGGFGINSNGSIEISKGIANTPEYIKEGLENGVQNKSVESLKSRARNI